MKRVLCIFCCLILISGCSWFADKRVRVEPKMDVTSPRHRKMLFNLINNRYKTESMLRDVEAELAYRAYLKSQD